MFILDTDHIGIIQGQSEPYYSRMTARIAGHAATDFYVTIVSFHEQFLGWNAYINKARKLEGVIKGYDQLLKIITDFEAAQLLPFDHAAAKEFSQLRQQGIRVGTMDLRIAAIGLARTMTVLTRNISDFRLIPSLAVEDWTL